jgi:tetratricopeptide (TPR) repeat protein
MTAGLLTPLVIRRRIAMRMHRASVDVARCVLAAALLTASAAAPAQSPSALNNILFDPQPLVAVPRTVAQGSGAILSSDAPAIPSPLTDAPSTSVDDYLQSIAATELADGPFARGLLEQYLALGESYQQSDDHEAALAAFEKADYISRINNGLYSPDQFVIVENMIESYLARDEISEAASKERYLLSLQEQQYGLDSLSLVPALADVADWNFDLFNRQVTESNSVFSIGNGQETVSPRMMAFGSLMQAQTDYWRAINIMLSNGQYSDPQLRELERKLIETSFLTSNRDGLLRNPDFYLSQRSAYTGTRIRRSKRPNSPYFYTGRSAYERLMAYNVMSPGADAVTVAQTLIALGDWNLLFDRQGTAIKTYRRAHAFMVDNHVPQETIDRLLSPAVPQQLPVFTPLPHSRGKFGIAPDAEVPWDGYVDVSFRIMRFGQIRDFEVLDRKGPLTADMETRLRRLIRSSPFRPRFVDGEPALRDRVTVRYYYAQM